VKIPITTGKTVEILGIFAKFLNNSDFISRTENAVVSQIKSLRTDMVMKVGLKCFLECLTFGPLMIDFDAVEGEVAVVGGFFVGEDNGIEIVEICGEKRNKRQNARDRNVSIIPLSALVHSEEFGVKSSSVENSGSVHFAGCEGVKRILAHTSEREGLVALLKELNAEEGVFSATEEKKDLVILSFATCAG
jgi:hypothetical protein